MRVIRYEKSLSRIRLWLFGIKVFSWNRRKKRLGNFNLQEYSQWIHDIKNNTNHFVKITQTPYIRKETDPKIFAYYLSQFHSIPENDIAYGKGFTEWTNVASSTPMFVGHHQPKIPYDVGFYNLNDISVMRRQAELATMYGVYGFCFYYYWFSGKKVLEKPLYNFLESDIALPFHFCWANESWSKLWDGGDKEIILKQTLEDGDSHKFFRDILPFIKDARYEKIDNKPIVMIYRPHYFEKEKMKAFLQELTKMALNEGFDGFYFMSAESKDSIDLEGYGLDGIIEFPPRNLFVERKSVHGCVLDTKAKFEIVDSADFSVYINNKSYIYDTNYTLFKCCFPSWDNTPRKVYSQGLVFLMNKELFKSWLIGIIEWTKIHNPPNKQYVYIHAWNEWAEGAILEPDTRYGYQNLEIVKQSIEETRNG